MGLDSVELILDIETEFGLSIPDAAAGRLATVGQIYDYLCRESPQLRGRRVAGVYAGPDWDRLVRLMQEQLAIESTRVRPDASIVRDLGLD